MSPGTKGMRVLSSWRGVTGAFSCSPKPRGASKALSLSFELLVQTSLSPQSETPSKTVAFHPVPIEPRCRAVNRCQVVGAGDPGE